MNLTFGSRVEQPLTGEQRVAMETLSNALREVALFRDISPAEMESLARKIATRTFGRNQIIFSQGDPADGLYIIVHGYASISRQNPGGDELIYEVCGPGEYFGELALFDGAPRSAGATAIEECSVLFLSRPDFRA
ncbi:MAG: cyclic nucleotide-binding domain-containing protein, partial [Chloroflexota bacterium]